MYKAIMESMGGVSIYPVISLLIFFGLFLGVVYWIVKMDKHHVQHMGNLPLEPGSDAPHYLDIEGEGNHGN